MNFTKRVLFIISLIIGNIAIGVVVFYYYDRSSMFESIAMFTSLATAIYAILAEPKERIEPVLRITPLLKQWDPKFLRYNLDIWIENIGYSIAKDIEVRCKISGESSIYVKNDGIFKHPLLAPKEIIQFRASECTGHELLSQQLVIEVSYSNENSKKQKPIKKGYTIRELEQGLREVKTS
jgi:hypothetical protein